MMPAERLGAYALGAALGLTSATQLRAPLLPVGPGEVLLALWLVWAVFSLARVASVARNALVRPIVSFWLVTIIALTLGWCSGLYLNLWDSASTRDAIAVLLAAGVAILSVVQRRAEQRLWAASGSLAVTLVVGLGTLLILAAIGRPVVGPISSLYGGLRFAGWALNPNQSALAISIVPFIAWEHRRASSHALARLCWRMVALGGLVIGIATLSDALMLGWGVAVAFGCARWWAAGTFGVGPSRTQKRLAIFAVPLLVITGLIVAGPTLLAAVESGAESSYDSGGQGSDRVARWQHGLDAAARAPVFGLGPGSYSGPFAAFQGEEAHNTPIDWLDATGVVGLVALLGLWGWVALRVSVSDRTGAGIALCGLLVFSMFHFVLRQPVFWFFLLALAAPLPAMAQQPRHGVRN